MPNMMTSKQFYELYKMRKDLEEVLQLRSFIMLK